MSIERGGRFPGQMALAVQRLALAINRCGNNSGFDNRVVGLSHCDGCNRLVNCANHGENEARPT
jgi:hypothetical protein